MSRDLVFRKILQEETVPVRVNDLVDGLVCIAAVKEKAFEASTVPGQTATPPRRISGRLTVHRPRASSSVIADSRPAYLAPRVPCGRGSTTARSRRGPSVRRR
jgi:hypothetical protein